jgi:hypothetical protein
MRAAAFQVATKLVNVAKADIHGGGGISRFVERWYFDSKEQNKDIYTVYFIPIFGMINYFFIIQTIISTNIC